MNHSKKIMSLIYWICPTVSIFCMTAVFIYALGYPVSMKLLGPLFCGVLFMIIGNYLPKCKPNYTIGIKVPWTLNSTENWTKTHRFAGPLWFFSGILIIVFSLFSLEKLSFIALLITVFIPILYSYLYFRKYECRK